MAGKRGWSGQAVRGLRPDYRDGRVWYVARTNARCEDRAMATLAAAGFEAFLPKGKREVIHHRTKARIQRSFPLLVGYAFVAMPVDARERHWGIVRACHGVHSVLGLDCGRPVLLSREIERLLLADAAGRITIKRKPLVKGETARILSGPFASFVGEIVEDEVRETVDLLINLFNGLVQVTVPVDELEAACQFSSPDGEYACSERPRDSPGQ